MVFEACEAKDKNKEVVLYIYYIAMSDIFKEFAENRSRMVWFPWYTPLWQKVEIPKLKKKDPNAYAREYYAKHREELCRKAREKWAAKKKKKVVVKKVEVVKDDSDVIRLKWKIAELEQEIKRLNKEIDDRDEDVKRYSSAVLSNLENKNAEMRVEMDEMKYVIKFLFRYFK